MSQAVNRRNGYDSHKVDSEESEGLGRLDSLEINITGAGGRKANNTTNKKTTNANKQPGTIKNRNSISHTGNITNIYNRNSVSNSRNTNNNSASSR